MPVLDMDHLTRPSATIEKSDSEMWTWHFMYDERLFCVCSDPWIGEASIIPRHPYEMDGTELSRPDFREAVQKMVSFKITDLKPDTLDDGSIYAIATGEPRKPVRRSEIGLEVKAEPTKETMLPNPPKHKQLTLI